ncbi:MAG: hypothetical protein DRP09_15855 [Candidatus Thorarchaeota archaeon]|nr:MAG: hypothetical protein DRP09_15855 [Candidatus Thorarchaeota archaeon]
MPTKKELEKEIYMLKRDLKEAEIMIGCLKHCATCNHSYASGGYCKIKMKGGSCCDNDKWMLKTS